MTEMEEAQKQNGSFTRGSSHQVLTSFLIPLYKLNVMAGVIIAGGSQVLVSYFGATVWSNSNVGINIRGKRIKGISGETRRRKERLRETLFNKYHVILI